MHSFFQVGFHYKDTLILSLVYLGSDSLFFPKAIPLFHTSSNSPFKSLFDFEAR